VFITTKRTTNKFSINNILRIFLKNLGRIQGYGLLAFALVTYVDFCLAPMTHLDFFFFLICHI
jgi:hypothetical protein